MRRFFFVFILGDSLNFTGYFLGVLQSNSLYFIRFRIEKIFYIFAFFADWNIFLLISIIVQ